MPSRGLRIRVLGVILLVSLVSLTFNCGSGPADSAANADAQGETGTPEFAVGVGKGDPAPDFALSDLAGGDLKLSELSGKVKLIDFWATWCAPCIEEIPMLVELDQLYRDSGLEIIAISDESRDVLEKFRTNHDIAYRFLHDDQDVSADYLVLGLPYAILVDEQGTIVDTYLGPKPRRILERRIRELLELPPAT
jgi:thiol-disulfide isomerase/thioredoxin